MCWELTFIECICGPDIILISFCRWSHVILTSTLWFRFYFISIYKGGNQSAERLGNSPLCGRAWMQTQLPDSKSCYLHCFLPPPMEECRLEAGHQPTTRDRSAMSSPEALHSPRVLNSASKWLSPPPCAWEYFVLGNNLPSPKPPPHSELCTPFSLISNLKLQEVNPGGLWLLIVPLKAINAPSLSSAFLPAKSWKLIPGALSVSGWRRGRPRTVVMI